MEPDMTKIRTDLGQLTAMMARAGVLEVVVRMDAAGGELKECSLGFEPALASTWHALEAQYQANGETDCGQGIMALASKAMEANYPGWSRGLGGSATVFIEGNGLSIDLGIREIVKRYVGTMMEATPEADADGPQP